MLLPASVVGDREGPSRETGATVGGREGLFDGGRVVEAGRRPEMESSTGGGSPYVFAAPVAPGKEEAWRRFIQEVAESRAEYEELRGRLGIVRELVWLVPLTRGYATVAYLEIDGTLDEFVRRLAAAEEGFDLWFKEGISECHGGIRSARLSMKSLLEPIFSWHGGSARSSNTHPWGVNRQMEGR